MVSHERKWGRFSLTHGQGINGREEREREVTEKGHQKSYQEWWQPRGWAYGMLLELFMCLRRCTEVFLLGAGTLGVSSHSVTPLSSHRSLQVAGALMAFKCLTRAHTKNFRPHPQLGMLKESFTQSGSSY